MNRVEERMAVEGIVFNVQRFTIHDGPGVRTEFFLKGCPLRCKWCGNPESMKANMQLGVYKSKCLTMKKCGACLEVCPQKEALQIYRGKLTGIDASKCINCYVCHDACPSDAIKKWGNPMTVDACMELIRKDRGYYERSGGGVTVSGGDPILQNDFVVELFKACKEEGIHTCFESAFHTNWCEIEKLLPYTDLFISDIKHMDSKVHQENTGVPNTKILENMEQMARAGKELILRIPVIPKFNDDMKNMEATADFIIEKMGGNVRTLQLLSYMRLGEEKYQSLGREYPMAGVRIHRQSFQRRIKEYAEYFNSRGIHCLVGTKEKE